MKQLESPLIVLSLILLFGLCWDSADGLINITYKYGENCTTNLQTEADCELYIEGSLDNIPIENDDYANWNFGASINKFPPNNSVIFIFGRVYTLFVSQEAGENGYVDHYSPGPSVTGIEYEGDIATPAQVIVFQNPNNFSLYTIAVVGYVTPGSDAFALIPNTSIMVIILLVLLAAFGLRLD